MIEYKILSAIKSSIEQLSDDKLLPVVKALMSVWEGDSHKYQQLLQELQKKFLKDLEKAEKEG